jgi:hypothetical protein
MRILKLLIFNFFVVGNLVGQTYHPLIRPSIYWEVLNGDGQEICQYSGGSRYYFQGDTTISGKTYKLIKANPIVSLATSPPAPPNSYCPPFAVNLTSVSIQPVFIREDSSAKKVYMYDYTYGDTLLYDFNLTDGDTLISAAGGIEYRLAVDSVRTIALLNGDFRKKFYLSNGANYIESIGGSEGLQFSVNNFGIGLGYWNEPLCLMENNVQLWGDQCLGTVSVREIDLDRISVFPNPAADFIYIAGKVPSQATLIIADVTGRIVHSKTIYNHEERIDISFLSTGSYIYKVEVINKNMFGKLIVVK